MGDHRLPGWAYPYEGIGFWPGMLRVLVYSGGVVLLIDRLGGWGLLALPLLIPLVWVIEGAARWALDAWPPPDASDDGPTSSE